MVETKEKTINGIKYSVTQFPARRALKVKAKLSKLLAPSALSAAGSLKGGSIMDGANLDMGLLSKAVEMLMSKIDEDTFVSLILEILACTRREGKELTETHFDMVYAGNFAELYKAIFFTLEVNFGSFLSQLNIGSLIKDQLEPTH